MVQVMLSPLSGRLLFTVTGLLWMGAVGFGTRVFLNYENASGKPGEPPAQWPLSSQCARSPTGFTLVMLAHPDCPCTKASLEELDGLMAHLPEPLTAYILFSKPEGPAAEVESSDLWQRASRIPGVSARFDRFGVEAAKFGGNVSGQTMLYGPTGHLVFTGGITAARGHQGANAGVDSILLAVAGKPAEVARTPVFGCSLHDPDAQALKENPAWKRF
jgi:hypothetical protein